MTEYQLQESWVQCLAVMCEMLHGKGSADQDYYDEMRALRDMNCC